MKKWMIFWGLLVFLTGCGAKLTDEAVSKVQFVKAAEEIGDKTPEERALTIKSRLKQIEGVVGTAVVVEGHTAIIGLRLEENMEQNEISAVKKEAERAAKGADVFIESASVTANGYIVSLIEDMERERAG